MGSPHLAYSLLPCIRPTRKLCIFPSACLICQPIPNEKPYGRAPTYLERDKRKTSSSRPNPRVLYAQQTTRQPCNCQHTLCRDSRGGKRICGWSSQQSDPSGKLPTNRGGNRNAGRRMQDEAVSGAKRDCSRVRSNFDVEEAKEANGWGWKRSNVMERT